MSVSIKKANKTNQHSVFDFFPTPRFLEMPAPGLSLSESGMHLIEFLHTKKSVSVGKFAHKVFSGEWLRGGDVEDSAALTADLEKFRIEHDLHYIRASLPEEKAYLFSTVLGSEQVDNIHTALEFLLEENVPLTLAESVFDYHIGSTDSETGKTRVSVSVVAESSVQKFLDIFRAAGFVPLHFEIESQAITKALIASGDTRVSLILNVGVNKIGFYICDGRSVVFTSTIPFEEINDPKSLNEETARAIGEEIRKFSLFWQSQLDKASEKPRPVERFLILSPANIRNKLTVLLGQKFDVSFEEPDVWTNLFSTNEYIPPISRSDSHEYAVAVGLAMPRLKK